MRGPRLPWVELVGAAGGYALLVLYLAWPLPLTPAPRPHAPGAVEMNGTLNKYDGNPFT